MDKFLNINAKCIVNFDQAKNARLFAFDLILCVACKFLFCYCISSAENTFKSFEMLTTDGVTIGSLQPFKFKLALT